MEAGLDYVKLDASSTRGLAQDPARANYVTSTVRMLHGLGLQVYAEGVVNAEDAARLWQCRVDGITGPVVRGAVRGTPLPFRGVARTTAPRTSVGFAKASGLPHPALACTPHESARTALCDRIG